MTLKSAVIEFKSSNEDSHFIVFSGGIYQNNNKISDAVYIILSLTDEDQQQK